MKSRLSLRIAVVTMTSLPLGACASSQLGSNPPLDSQASGGALITVENQHTSTMRIYLGRSETAFPLGVVETLERRTFVVPTALLGHSGELRLIADPLGSATVYRSRAIPAGPGDRVRWTIAHHPPLSTHSVQRIAGR